MRKYAKDVEDDENTTVYDNHLAEEKKAEDIIRSLAKMKYDRDVWALILRYHEDTSYLYQAKLCRTIQNDTKKRFKYILFKQPAPFYDMLTNTKWFNISYYSLKQLPIYREHLSEDFYSQLRDNCRLIMYRLFKQLLRVAIAMDHGGVDSLVPSSWQDISHIGAIAYFVSRATQKAGIKTDGYSSPWRYMEYTLESVPTIMGLYQECMTHWFNHRSLFTKSVKAPQSFLIDVVTRPTYMRLDD